MSVLDTQTGSAVLVDNTLYAAGLLLVLLGSAVRVTPTSHLWPWLLGWLALTWLLVEEARSPAAGIERRLLPSAAAAGALRLASGLQAARGCRIHVVRPWQNPKRRYR